MTEIVRQANFPLRKRPFEGLKMLGSLSLALSYTLPCIRSSIVDTGSMLPDESER
jgi:hypothetical protein